MLVHAFITCRLDQCNSLLYALPESQIVKLQRIQYSAARLVLLSRKYDHITSVLHELHWPPVTYRIINNILLLTYKCLHGMGPIYLQELLKEYKHVRNLRSSVQLRLITSITSTQYGYRSFSAAASELWNDLPLHVIREEISNSCSIQNILKDSFVYISFLTFFVTVCCIRYMYCFCSCA